MGWGEEIDFSSVCVVETVFLLLLALNIAFVVVMVMYQNRQMIVTSFGCCCGYSGGTLPESRLLEFLQRPGENVSGGGWRVIAVLLKMYVKMACEIWVGG